MPLYHQLALLKTNERTNSDSSSLQRQSYTPHTPVTYRVVQKGTMQDISILACLPDITSPILWILSSWKNKVFCQRSETPNTAAALFRIIVLIYKISDNIKLFKRIILKTFWEMVLLKRSATKNNVCVFVLHLSVKPVRTTSDFSSNILLKKKIALKVK